MVKIIWEIWPLKNIKSSFNIDSLSDFRSLTYTVYNKKQQVTKECEYVVKMRIENIRKKIYNLEIWLNSFLNKKINWVFDFIKKWVVEYSKNREIWSLKKDLEHIKSNLNNVLKEELSRRLLKINLDICEMKRLKNDYFWWLWEEKVVNKIKSSFDYWVLINDFNIKFSQPVFQKWSKDKIMSAQIDHIFINEKWIFLIETKNWWNSSVDNDYYNAISQAKRHNTAFYRYIQSFYWWLFNSKTQPKIYNIVVSTWKQKINSWDKFIHSLKLNDLKWFINSRMWNLDERWLKYIVDKLTYYKHDLY